MKKNLIIYFYLTILFLLFKGVSILLGIKILSVECSNESVDGLYCAPWNQYTVHVEVNGEKQSFSGDALLNATGRAPNVHDVGLEAVSAGLCM